jgi:tRNA A58 N-methylase Trm61
MPEHLQPSGVRLGPLAAGERVTLTDPKGRRHSVVLTAGAQFHTAKGPVNHDQLIDRVILDMLAPWDCIAALAELLVPGGVFCAYVTTTTQLAQTVETLRAHTGFTEPEATESLVRGWHVEGLAVRPRHDMVGHTGFVITARRMAPGFTAPLRKRRPAPGAYGDDYKGPQSLPG